MRHKITCYILLLLLSLSIALSSPPRRPAQSPNLTGRVEETGGVRVVYLQGSPYEMGLQQGSLFRNELRELIRNYLYECLVLERGAAQLWLLAYARFVGLGVPRDLHQEMQGIADGAGLSYQDVLLLNTVPDLLALTHRWPSWRPSSLLFFATPPSATTLGYTSCMAFSAYGQATVDSELLLGHNLNRSEKDLLYPYLLVMVRQPAQGNAFVSVGLMGTVGTWVGMNEEKITIAMSSSPSADVGMNGQLLPFVLRRVLQSAGDLNGALNTILATQRLAGGNVLLGDGKAPAAIAFELSAHRQAILEVAPERGLLARTNHFISPELTLLQQNMLCAQEQETSQTRLNQIQTKLEFNRGWIGIEKALAFLIEDINTTEANTMPGSDTAAGSLQPLQSVLFYPGKLTLWVALDNRMKGPESFVRLELSQVLLGQCIAQAR